MKKVVMITMLFLGVTALAQRGPSVEGQHRGAMKDLTPEQMATLQTKKATLALDLSEAQQTQMKALFLEKAKARKVKMEERKVQKESGETKERTSEEKYARANARLDEQIAEKEKLKQILSEEQLEKWEKMGHHRSKRHNGKSRHRKGKKSKE